MSYCTKCGRETEWVSRSGYCRECAQQVYKEQQAQATKERIAASLPDKVSEKQWSNTFWLCLLLGVLGAHRFYVGKKGTGLIWLLTFGCGGLGWFIDMITICIGSFTDLTGAFILSERKRQLAEEIAEHKYIEQNRIKLQNEQAKRDIINEQYDARATWLDTHGELILNVAGVTYDTQSGISRQKILKALCDAQDMGEEPDLELFQYKYRGEDAINVLANGEDIGAIRKSDLSEVLPILYRNPELSLWVEPFETDDEFTGRTKNLYRAELTIHWIR